MAGRAATPIPPSAYERDHRAQAGLFAIATFEELVSMTVATLGDASAEVTLFALADDGLDRLLGQLRSRRRPSLEEVLEPGDRFFDLTIGVDHGYLLAHLAGKVLTSRLNSPAFHLSLS